MENKREKIRLDVFLVSKNFIESRSKARQIIENGSVKVNGNVCKNPAKLIGENDIIEVLEIPKYVSRAGYKLEGLFSEVQIELFNKTVCDIGSSTGGFVDFLLQHGAKKVYAVDVNTEQLHSKLTSDSRVIRIRKNAKELCVENIGEVVDIVTTDVSFISVRKIKESIWNILSPSGYAIVLIKPQFEIGHQHSGIVKSREKHIQVLQDVIQDFLRYGFVLETLTYSKILGSDGNIEFFAVFTKQESFPISEENNVIDFQIGDIIIKVVDSAWEEHYKCTDLKIP
ncbi:TlyA family RNA methyltransferase [Fervidobacterium sp.]